MALETKGPGETYEFGPFRLSVAERVLWRAGQIVPLPPKCFDTLLVLVRHSGSVVEKEALIRAIWPDSFVEEGNLAQNIFTIRKTLGELAGGGQYIQTLPKRGYRLVVPASAPQPATVAVAPPAKRSPRLISYALAAGIVVAVSLIAARWVWSSGAVPSPSFTALSVPNNILYGMIAPGGKQIAYVSHDAEGQSLWVRETSAVGAGTRIVPPVQGHFWGVGYPPDEQYLYYAFEDERDPAEASLFRVPADGGEAQKLLTGIATAPVFAPDGSRIAYKRYDPDGHGYLLTSTPLGGDRKILAQSDSPFAFHSYQWARNGKSIYYVEGTRDQRGTNWSVWEIPSGGGQARLVMAPQSRPILHVNWLGATEALALIPGEDSDAAQIWRVNTAGLFRRVTNDINDYSQISVTADARTLLANSQVTDDSIWTAPAPGTRGDPPSRVVLPGGSYNDPVWTPDGHIVFAAQSNLWIASVEGVERKPLLSKISSVFEPAVSPGGRSVVFVLRAGGSRNLWSIGMDGANLHQVTAGGYDWHPAISPNGKWVVYESRVSGKRTLRKAPLDGSGPPVKLAGAGATDLTVSPDSRLVAYRSDTGEVEVRSLEDGTLAATIAAPADPSALRWSGDGKALTYVCHAGSSLHFWSQPIAGGPPVRLEDSLPADVRVLDWSADRRRILYLRREIRVDLALITNLP